MIRLRTPFLAAALFTSVAVVGLTPALAQTAPGPANSTAASSEARDHVTGRMMPGQFVDGRIAFLKAELKITPTQETQWQQVAAAMRENAKALDEKSAARGRTALAWTLSSASSCASNLRKRGLTTMPVFSLHSSRYTLACRPNSSKWPTSWSEPATIGIIAPDSAG